MTRLVHAVGVIVLCAVAAMTIAAIAPPVPLPATADRTMFSAERAFAHLEVIAREPHPLGSRAHAEVRDYLVRQLTDLGLDVRVQESQAAARVVGTVWSARVENVVARLRGTRGTGQSLMLAAHYDSVPQSHGASDDGFGVVTLLETARALRAGPPLANDVLFVFTDGEELALRGAQAAVEDATVLKDVAIVLNVEARGTGGAVAMFETSDENGALIDALASAVPSPNASSFLTILAAALPNGTDSLVWKRTPMAVMGFAFGDGLAHYHRYTDDSRHIDHGSIQHGGSYALALARYFGDRDLGKLRAPDRVYFDLFGRVIIHMSTAFARVLALATVLLFAFVLATGLRARRLRRWDIAKGFGLAVGTTIAAGVVVAGAQMLLVRHVDFFMLLAWAKVFAWHSLLLGAAIVLALFSFALRRSDPRGLAIGAMLLWVVGLLVAAVLMPTLTAPLQWPLLFSLAGFIAWEKYKTPIALYVGAAAAIVIPANLVYAVFVAAGAMMPFAPVALFALSACLLLPLVAEAPPRLRWIAVGVALVASAVVLVIGFRSAKYRGEPFADSLVYTLDHDDGTARWWRSWYDDRWVRSRVPANAAYAPLPGFTRSDSPVPTAPAPRLDSAPAVLDVRSDDVVEKGRKVKLHITSPRRARCLSLWDGGGARIVFSPEVNGTPVLDIYRISPEADEDAMRRMGGDDTFRVWRMIHCGLTDAGVDLTLTVEGRGPIKLRIVEETEGLPATSAEGKADPLSPRPPTLIPAQESDVTLVGKTFSF